MTETEANQPTNVISPTPPTSYPAQIPAFAGMTETGANQPTNVTPALTNAIPPHTNITLAPTSYPAHSLVIPAPSNVIPAPSNVIPAPSNVIPAKAGIQRLARFDLPLGVTAPEPPCQYIELPLVDSRPGGYH